MSSTSKLALGLDLSTQQLKIVAVDIANLETFYEKSLTFESDLAHYKTTKGVYNNDEDHEVYSPVEMWIEAVDVILDKMKQDHFPFERVVVISGAGQVRYRGSRVYDVATRFRILVAARRGNIESFGFK
jgi:xylulokinase